jgi:hypothetical protein
LAFSKDFSALSTKINSLFLTPSLLQRISKISDYRALDSD